MTRASLGELFPIAAPVRLTLLPTRVWTQEHRSWTGRGFFEASFTAADGGWRITAAVAESTPERVRNVRAQRDRVLLELVLSAIVLGEPAAGLRADLVRLSLPPGCPAPSIGVIEHSVLGLRSGRPTEAVELGHPADPLMLVRIHQEAGTHAALEYDRHGCHRGLSP